MASAHRFRGIRDPRIGQETHKFELLYKSVLEQHFTDRMEQNEDIFVRFMNDAPFQELVTTWMAGMVYDRLRAPEAQDAILEAPTARSRLRIVEATAKERYVTCVPLVPLEAAAGAFSEPQHVDEGEFEWVELEGGRRLRPGMFVARVVGRSMEPAIPDGSLCLFAAPVVGSRQGRTVLVQLRDGVDPETGHRYTVKRYESEKVADGDSWQHVKITLRPANPAFEPIVLTGVEEDAVRVIAELIEVLGTEAEVGRDAGRGRRVS